MHVYSETVFFGLSLFIFVVSVNFSWTVTYDYLFCLASRALTDVCPLVNLLDYSFFQKLRGGRALQVLLCATILVQKSSIPCFEKRARESGAIVQLYFFYFLRTFVKIVSFTRKNYAISC